MGKMSQLAGRRRRGSKSRPQAADSATVPLAALQPQAVTEEASLAGIPEQSESSVIIFDWDDTLLPTWYLKQVVEPCTPGIRGAPVPPDSPFYEPLRRHAELVAEVLRSARAAGRVAVVTLSMRPWVHTSASQFLPGLDLQELLEELDIPIFYAFEHVHRSLVRIARSKEAAVEMFRSGTDVFATCKREAMKKCLRQTCGKSGDSLNVLSVGDSAIEKNALKDALWYGQRQAICKTLKLMEESGLEELGEQLHLFRAWLPSMMNHRQDFDMNIDEADDESFPQVNSVPLVCQLDG